MPVRARWLAALALCSACAAHPNVLRLAPTPSAEPDDAWRSAIPGSSAPRPPLALGATDSELIAVRLDRPQSDARAWQLDATVASGPVLAPGLCVFASGRELVALAADTGRRLWRAPARDHILLAATATPELTALLVSNARAERAVVVYDRRPSERLQIEADGGLGTPVFAGDTLLVPFGAGEVAAIDVRERRELGRARLGTELLHALGTSEGWFFGGPPWVALAERHAPSYALPRRPLPGTVESGAAPLSRDPRRADATRLYARPTRAAAREPSDMYMATFGRVALGLEREQGALAWVVALPGRALDARAVEGGFIVCDDSGTVRLLAERSGQLEGQWLLARQRRVTLGEPALTACALDGERVLASEPAAGAAPPPLLDQLARVLGSPDPELTEAQRYLARELAARPEPEATRVLIDLVTRHSLDRRLEAEAADLLAARRNGRDYMLTALAPTDEAAPPPPIAALAEALAALGESRAAPLLARQLNRPAHRAAAIARAAAALEKLATDAEYGELSVFFALHRTTADSADAVAAVVSVGRTLLRIGGQPARNVIQSATRDPLTIPEIRSALERELAARGPSGS